MGVAGDDARRLARAGARAAGGPVRADLAARRRRRSHLGGHEALFVLDLGLGYAEPTGTVRPHGTAVHDWVARTLPAYGGTLERAARFALRLAAVRTGALPGPEPLP